MKKERILKKDWPAFLKSFNTQYQFRPVRVWVDKEEVGSGLPFMGFVYQEKKKAVDLYVGKVDVESPVELVYTLGSPRALYVWREGDKVLGVEFHSAKGPKLAVEFLGLAEAAEEAKRGLIEKIAYELYLQRGGEHGRDLDDWLAAENLVETAAKLYV